MDISVEELLERYENWLDILLFLIETDFFPFLYKPKIPPRNEFQGTNNKVR